MVRAPVFCSTIVAVIQLHLTAAQPPAVRFTPAGEVPVSAPATALARSLGLDPELDRARFLSEFTRILYTPPAGRNREVAEQLRELTRPGSASGPGSQAPTVPVPLAAEVWSRAIFGRPVAADALLTAIATDRKAALVAHGLAALDDETLDYLSREHVLLQRLYEEGAAAFGAFGGSLRVMGNRVAPPGGAAAGALWAALLGQPIDQPALFIDALFTGHNGRLAYLYDTIASLDEARARFLLGLWIRDDHVRLMRFQALGQALVDAYPEWRLEALPFSRPLNDLALLMLRTRVLPDGAAAPPAARALWASVLEGEESRAVPEAGDAVLESVDAAWLVQTVTGGDMFWRGERLDQFAFAQRMFEHTSAVGWPGVIEAVRAFRSQRMLMLTLERMGVASPGVYAAAARAGARVGELGGARAFWTISQLQGALAILARLRSVGSIDVAAVEALTLSLVSLPLDQGQYQGAVAAWLARDLWPRLPRIAPVGSDMPADQWTKDVQLVSALAGRSPAGGGDRLRWEGQEYRVDLPFAERRRLRMVRERQRSYPIDLPMSLSSALDRLKRQRSPEDIQSAERELQQIVTGFSSELTRPAPDVMAPGVPVPRAAGPALAEILDDLGRARRARDTARGTKGAASLASLVDATLGETLLSFAYALEIGDPNGTALLTRNVALRHDFGLGRRDRPLRTRLAWAMPRQDFLPGIPWHVVGSALGLEVALSPLGLRRMGVDRPGAVPSLPSNERHAVATGVALMDPARLLDADRAQITGAIARGRARAAALPEHRDDAGAVADLLDLDSRRRRELAWTLINGSAADAERSFSLAEFLVLGGGAAGVDLNAWGTSGLQIAGCLCTRWMLPNQWRLLAGRPQLRYMTGVFPDLNLHVATVLGQLGVPANLTRTVLSSGALEFSEGVAMSDPGDWVSLVAGARIVSRERIEDYVAAAAVVDGALVPFEPSGSVSEEGRAR